MVAGDPAASAPLVPDWRTRTPTTMSSLRGSFAARPSSGRSSSCMLPLVLPLVSCCRGHGKGGEGGCVYVCMHIWSALSAEYGLTRYGSHFCSWSAERGKYFFPCPRSRLRVWSRETGSVVPSRVSPFILHTPAESDAYSRDPSSFPRRRPRMCCHPIYSACRSCGRTSRGHTGGRSHRISPPSSCGACPNFHREKDSAVPFPRRP